VEPEAKFFNDFWRARACACARGRGHPESRVAAQKAAPNRISRLTTARLRDPERGLRVLDVGAEHNEAIGRRMTQAQDSNSVAKHSALIVSHARSLERQVDP
jgi:hypothetical protein